MFFTVCYIRDLGNAVLLGNSLKKFYPETPFKIFLADKIENIPAKFQTEFEIEAIDLLTLAELAKYNWNELKDNCKPFIAQKLLEKHQQVSYFDATSVVFSSLNSILENSANMILVPQLLFANKYPKENEALNEGIYHAGFFSMRQSDESLKLVNWWKNKAFEKGFERVCEGMNKDRLILELVPVLYKGVHVEKNPAINVGKWNLAERNFSLKNGQYFIENQKLLSFNFKGSEYFDSLKNELKQFSYLQKIKPAFGIPVIEKTVLQKVFEPTIKKAISAVDVFFDKF